MAQKIRRSLIISSQGGFTRQISFQIDEFEFDLKTNSSGRTWTYEYTPPNRSCFFASNQKTGNYIWNFFALNPTDIFSFFWSSYGTKYLKTYKFAWRHIVLHCFSIYDDMTHNVVYLFSIYHGEVITPNFGNYQADMTNSPSALTQSKLLKYLQ